MEREPEVVYTWKLIFIYIFSYNDTTVSNRTKCHKTNENQTSHVLKYVYVIWSASFSEYLLVIDGNR